MTPETLALIDSILGAETSEDVLKGRSLRQVLALLHPDKHPEKERAEVGMAFAQLQGMVNAEKRRSDLKFEMASRKRSYHADGLAFTGRVGNLYSVTYERDGKPKQGLLKLPRSPKDNDLITAEATALKKLFATEDDRLPFINRFEDSFRQKDSKTGAIRHVVVVRRLRGFISLADVLRAFPHGLDARDLAWIWRRALVALSLLKDTEIVHGSVTPEHLLIHPELHGVILCGFTSAVESGQVIKVAGGSKSLLAPEVLAKQPATIATDIYSLSMTMRNAFHPSVPTQFHSFVKGCTFERPGVRPSDPLRLLEEFDELLVRLYGPRKFRKFPNIPGWSK